MRALAGAAAIAAASVTSHAAFAAPAVLANDSDVAAFAARLKAFAGASRVRWSIAASSKADAEALIANIGLHMASEDRGLLARVTAQSFADSPEIAPGASIPVAWMAPQTGLAPAGPKCSWQVWVTDPSFPSATASAVSVPLAPNDKLPVGAGSTFRVGYTGLLQSKLYAFDETQPGAIRDLASAPDVNIPVAANPSGETILLAMARQPAPFLEGIRHGSGRQRRAEARSRQGIRPARESEPGPQHRRQYPTGDAQHGDRQGRDETLAQARRHRARRRPALGRVDGDLPVLADPRAERGRTIGRTADDKAETSRRPPLSQGDRLAFARVMLRMTPSPASREKEEEAPR